MFKFPELWPEHEADFTTLPKEFVECRVVGIQMGQNERTGDRTVDLALKVRDGQKAVLEGDPTPSDVGGRLVLHRGGLKGGGAKVTLDKLRGFGFSAAAAAAAYSADPGAISIQQQARAQAPGLPADKLAERLQEAMGWLAIQRGDFTACGMTKVARCTFDVNTFQAGDHMVSYRRLNWVNVVPSAATEQDVLGLLGIMSGAASQSAAPRAQAAPRTGTSPPPTAQHDGPADF